LGLDEELNAIMKDVDLTDILREFRKGKKDSINRSNLLKDLIEKV
jgi:hypothetical protein